jgi:hypothetical protein
MNLEIPPNRKDEHPAMHIESDSQFDSQHSKGLDHNKDHVNQAEVDDEDEIEVDDGPKFGRLLIVLLLAVILIVIITLATEAYHRT